ncbi:hypothetical protein EV359DRAFT_50377, partial [Lentinula novae-zelandiae]
HYREQYAPAGPLPLAMQAIQNNGVYNELSLGKMEIKCSNCKAFHWKAEMLTTSRGEEKLFGTCCLSGKVRLPLLEEPPVELLQLFNGEDHNSQHFLENIRTYNAAYAFVSLGLKLQPQNDPELPQTGVKQFKIKGELWHSLGSLLPEPGKNPIYAQLYIMTPETCKTWVRIGLRVGLV